MAAVPDTQTFVDGVATSSEQNTYIRDPIRFLLNKPAAELRQTVAQSILNGAATAVTFDAFDLDSNPSVPFVPGHSNSVNNSRYTAVYAGWYQVSGGAGFVANAVGRRILLWYVNGSPINGSQNAFPSTGAGDNGYPARSIRVYLNVGDYAELFVLQESGGALNTSSALGTNNQARMSIAWDRNQ